MTVILCAVLYIYLFLGCSQKSTCPSEGDRVGFITTIEQSSRSTFLFQTVEAVTCKIGRGLGSPAFCRGLRWTLGQSLLMSASLICCLSIKVSGEGHREGTRSLGSRLQIPRGPAQEQKVLGLAGKAVCAVAAPSAVNGNGVQVGPSTQPRSPGAMHLSQEMTWDSHHCHK